MWDTDYSGLVLRASQVFFPCIGACDNLQKRLETEFNDRRWTHLAGTEAEPVVWGEHRRIASKVFDERSNGLKVVREPEA